MGSMKTPGVYIVEKSPFPNSVVEAPTAIPVFIGITERALNGNDDLKGKPWKISSMTEYEEFFGQGPEEKFILSIKKAGAAAPGDCLFSHEVDYTEATGETVTTTTKYVFTAQRKEKNRFTLYYQMMMFFANGGGTCYILSVGHYKDNQLLDKDMVSNAIKALEKEREVTMVVIPEAVYSPSCWDIEMMALEHCGKMQNRFAILDVQAKTSETQTLGEQIKEFQTHIGNNCLSYGAAYYPWLETSLLVDREITADMFIWASGTELDFKAFFDKDSSILKYANAAISEIMGSASSERKIT